MAIRADGATWRSRPSMTDFVLDARLAADGLPLGAFALCRLLLMNDATYPWLILVPQRHAISEVFELTSSDRIALAGETATAARMLKALCAADKINVAALGNVVAQLHVHVIARFETDPAWPAPVWGRVAAKPYAPEEAEAMGMRLVAGLDALAAGPEADTFARSWRSFAGQA